MVKIQKAIKEEQRNKQDMRYIENKEQTGHINPTISKITLSRKGLL